MPQQASSEQPQMRDGTYAVVLDLLTKGKTLPEPSLKQVVELGDLAVPALINILEDGELQMQESPGDSWAPIHAAELLGELKAPEAIEPLLEVLADTDTIDIIHDALTEALGDLGESVLEPALKAYSETDDHEYQRSLCYVLSRLGVHDERIFTILLGLLAKDTELGAMCLTDYDDPEAIEYLSRCFDEQKADNKAGPLSNHVFVELRCAIEELGGSLTPEQQAIYDRADEPAQEFRRLMWEPIPAKANKQERRKEKTGRNAPCWCGSGKKYKRCHWAEDNKPQASA